MPITLPVAATADDRTFQRIADRYEKWGKDTGAKIGSALSDGIDDPKIEKAFSKVSDAMSKVRAEEAKLQDLRDKGASNSRIVTQSEALARARNAETRATADAVRAYDALANKSTTLANASGLLRDALAGTRFGQLAAQTDTLTASLGRVGFAVGATTIGLTGLAVGIVAAGKALYDLGERWDAVGDKIAVRTGKYGADLDAITDSVKRVANDTAAPLEVIGDAAGQLVQTLGLSGPQLDEMTRKLAQLTQMGQPVAVTDLAAAFKAFNVDAKDQPALLDQLFRVYQKTGISVGELASTMARSGNSARNLGLDFTDTARVLVAFNAAGIDTSRIAQDLQMAMTNFAKSGREPVSALGETIDKIDELIKAGDENQARTLAQTNLGKKAWQDVFNVIQTQGTAAFDQLNKHVDKTGDAIGEAAKNTSDFAEEWTKLKNSLSVGLEWAGTAVFGAINMQLGQIVDNVRSVQSFLTGSSANWGPPGTPGTVIDPSNLAGVLGVAGAPDPLAPAAATRPPGVLSSRAGNPLTSDQPYRPYWGYPDKAAGSQSRTPAAQVLYGSLPAIGPGVPMTPEVYSAQTRLWEANHAVEEKRARLQQLESDNAAKAEDVLAARNDVARAERDQQEAQMRLQATQQSTLEKQTQQLSRTTDDLGQIGAQLDQDFGISKGLAGIVENITKAVANLAAAPLIGALSGGQMALGYSPGSAGSGLTGILAASGAFGSQYQAMPAGYGQQQSYPATYGPAAQSGGAALQGAPMAGAPTGVQYGLPQGTNTGGYGTGTSKVFPPWVMQLADAFGIKPSTYSGHQESDRHEPGFAPNPMHQNRGIDWSGSVPNMQNFADYLSTVPQSLEQVIWQNPNTGQVTSIAGGRPVNGYYDAGTLDQHGNHVHTRQSAAIPLPGMGGTGGGGGFPGLAGPPQSYGIPGMSYSLGLGGAPTAGGPGLGNTVIGGLAPKQGQGSGFGGISGGILGAAMGAAGSAAGLAASAMAGGSDGGAGGAAASAAMQIGIQEINRAIAFGGQAAGILASGAMETFLPFGASELAQNNWLTRIIGGIVGATPSIPNVAGGSGKKTPEGLTPEQAAQHAGNGQPPGPLDPQQAARSGALGASAGNTVNSGNTYNTTIQSNRDSISGTAKDWDWHTQNMNQAPR